MAEITYNLDQITPLVPRNTRLFTFLEPVRAKVATIGKSKAITSADLETIGQELAQSFIRGDFKRPTEADWQKTNEKALEILRKNYGINHDDEVAEARTAVLQGVNALSIPEDAKRIIRGHLDQTSYDTRSRKIDTRYIPENKHFIVSLSPALHLAIAYQISEAFGIEISEGLLRSIIYSSVGHESGHIIGASLVDGETFVGKSAAIRYGDKYMEDFPITYKFESEKLDSDRDYYNSMKEERFAAFFAQDLLRGKGLSVAALRDTDRMHIANIFDTGLGPFELMDVLARASMNLNAYAEQDAQAAAEGKALFNFVIEEMIMANTDIAELFPYKQSEVEDILNNAWQVVRSSPQIEKPTYRLILAEHEQRAMEFVLEVRRLLLDDKFVKAGCRGRAFTKLEDAFNPLAAAETMPELKGIAGKIGIDKLRELAALEYKRLTELGIDIASISVEGPMEAFEILQNLRAQVQTLAQRYGGIERFPPSIDLDKSGEALPSDIVPIVTDKAPGKIESTYRYLAAYTFSGNPINPKISSKI